MLKLICNNLKETTEWSLSKVLPPRYLLIRMRKSLLSNEQLDKQTAPESIDWGSYYQS